MPKENKTIAEWFEEGVRCFKKPDGVAAVQAFDKVIDLDPAYCHSDGDNPYFYLGKIHEVEGDLDEAVICYTRALALDPRDEESLIGRGSCLTVQDQPARAIDDFKKVLAISPEQRRAPLKYLYYAIAENYRKTDDWPRAVKWGKLALREDPFEARHMELVKKAMEKLDQIV
jgi:tetratricopeptide (TPR) repeat protein